MLHTKFRENRSVGTRVEDFEGLLPYMGVAFIKMVQIDTVVSEKIRFEFLYVHNLGPRLALTFNTHIP